MATPNETTILIGQQPRYGSTLARRSHSEHDSTRYKTTSKFYIIL